MTHARTTPAARMSAKTSRMSANAGRMAVRGAALAVALATATAPAAAEYRNGATHDWSGAYSVRDHGAPYRGCGPRARARGWCHGERIGDRHGDGYGDGYGGYDDGYDRYDSARERFDARQEERRRARSEPSRGDQHDGNDDLALALGIAGLAAGVLVLGTLANRDARSGASGHGDRVIGRVAPDGSLIAAPRVVKPVSPAPRAAHRDIHQFPAAPENPPLAVDPYEPWSRAWLEACRERYRSFDQRTGTFRGYDGNDHFCRP